MRAALVAISLAACRPAPRVVEHIATPPEGLTIALYEDGERRFSLVDDRRTLEVRGGELVLDQLAAGASLSSLVVEPASRDGQGLVVGACRRDADVVRCAASGATGRTFVRILYVSDKLAFRSRHAIVVDGSHAKIDTQFEIELPAWGRRARLSLFDGIPGGARPPQLLGTLEQVLDGTTVMLHAPLREAKARRITVFDPLRAVGDEDSREEDASSGKRAWEWAELVGVALPPGEIDILVDEASDHPVATELATSAAVEIAGNLRIPLRPDGLVRGRRERRGGTEGRTVLDTFEFAVTNDDTRPRLVLVEEELRTSKQRSIASSSPRKPEIVDDIARVELDVPPSGTVRVRFVVSYEL